MSPILHPFRSPNDAPPPPRHDSGAALRRRIAEHEEELTAARAREEACTAAHVQLVAACTGLAQAMPALMPEAFRWATKVARAGALLEKVAARVEHRERYHANRATELEKWLRDDREALQRVERAP